MDGYRPGGQRSRIRSLSLPSPVDQGLHRSQIEPPSTPGPIGLIAGWGSFPIEVARAIVASGGHVVCIGLRDHADWQLESICDDVRWSGVGRMGTHVRYFRRCGVRKVTMAGKLFKADILYRGSVLWRHRPDLTCLRTVGPLLMGRSRDARDDRLLTAITHLYENHQMEVCPATDLAPELLVAHGPFAGPPIAGSIASDAAAGWQVAKAMGGLDVGQTITIKDGTVIAVEAIEGTDACIERTGSLCRRGGWTLVKVSKPNQDMRFDVPTIGPGTVCKVAEAGGRAIVIESERTIIVERQETARLAEKHGIAILARRDTQSREMSAAA